MKQFIMTLSVVIGLNMLPVVHGMTGFNAPGQEYTETLKQGGVDISAKGVPADKVSALKAVLSGSHVSTNDASVGQLVVALAKKSACNTAGYLASFFPTTRKGCAITVAIPTVIMTAAYGMWFYQTGEIPTMTQMTDFLRTNMADVVAFAKAYAWKTGRSFFLTGNEELLLQRFGDKFVDIASLADQAESARQCFNETHVDLLGNNVIGCLSQALNVTAPINGTFSRGAVEFAMMAGGGMKNITQAVGEKIVESGSAYVALGSKALNLAAGFSGVLADRTAALYGWARGN